MRKNIGFIFLFISLTAFAKNDQKEASSRIHSIASSTPLKQLIVPDYDQLSLARKLYAYYLSQAIEAGRDIAWTQATREGLRLRQIFDLLYSFRAAFSTPQTEALETYLLQLHRNHGNYSSWQNKKFVLTGITHEELLGMVNRAAEWAQQETQFDQELLHSLLQFQKEAPQVLATLDKEIFDLNDRPDYHAPDGIDPIVNAGSNFYGKGVTKDAYDHLAQEVRENRLNFLVHSGDGVVAVPHAIGVGSSFDGELRAIYGYFELAKQYATAPEKTILSAYQKAMVSGDPADLDEADKLWIQHPSPDVDFTIGFVETYDDPIGVRGTWGGTVYIRKLDPKSIEAVERIRANAPYFEKNLPGEKRFKKDGKFNPPQADAVYVLYGGGDSGEAIYKGKKLPNSDVLSETIGSKTWQNYNVTNDLGPNQVQFTPEETQAIYGEKYAEAMRNGGSTIARRDRHTQFHEIYGHGSGKIEPGISRLDLAEMYTPLEECRAESIALYHAMDPKLMKFGILPKMSKKQFRMEMELNLVSFFSAHLSTYALLPDHAVALRQAHQWARQVIMNRMIDAGAIEVTTSYPLGTPRVNVLSLERAHRALTSLIEEVQEARFTANLKKATALFEHWGKFTETHQKWMRGMKATYEAIPKLATNLKPIFLNPQFKLETNAESRITDVSVEYVMDSNGNDAFFERQNERLKISHDAARTICNNILAQTPAHQ